MQEEVNKAIARRYYDEIMNGANLDTIDELLSPDFIFTIPTHPEPYHGPEGFKQLVTMLHGAFPDVHLTVEHLIAEGDTVVGHWTGSGTHKVNFRVSLQLAV
jgi:ketosteroid isomerase-like protein